MGTDLTNAVADLLRREPAKIVAGTGILFDSLAKTYPQRTLADALESHRGGVWGEEGADSCGYPVLRSTNMRGSKADFVDVAWREIPAKQATDCALRTGDILVTKSSGSSDLVGKSVLFIHPDDRRTYLFSNFTLRLRPNASVIISAFLAWFLRSPQALGWRYATQQNAVGLRNLQTDQFLSQRLPMPPLSVQHAIASYLDALEAGRDSNVVLPTELTGQRRIVSRIEGLATKIQEARSLRVTASGQLGKFKRSMVDTLLNSSKYKALTLGDLLTEDSLNGISTRPETNGLGIEILRISAGTSREDGLVDETDVKYLPIDPQKIEKYRLRQDDLLACRFNGNLGYVGRFSLYASYRRMFQVYPDKLIRFRVRQETVLPQFVRYAMNSAWGRDQIEPMCATTAGNLGISATQLKNVRVPVPSIEDQTRIIARLDSLQAKALCIGTLQSETGAELDALIPSILSKAFRGEL
jgi:hypothetical protein